MKVLLSTILFLLISRSTISQPANNAILKEVADVKIRSFSQSNFTPFGSSAFSNLISNISISSSYNNGENAKAELKYTTKNWWTTGVSLDQKLGKTGTEAILLDFFDGISPGTTFGFSLQKIFWSPVLDQAEFDKFNDAANAYACRVNRLRPSIMLQDILRDGNQSEKNLVQSIQQKQPIFFNIRISFTKTNYTFTTDSSSLKEIEQSYLTPNVSAFIGIPLNIRNFLAFSYNYLENYQSENEVTFISPFGTSNNFITETLSFGNPQKQKDNKLNAEWRMHFGNENARSSFSIGPSLTWGLSSKKIAIFLPVYFINGKTSEKKITGLQGGFRLRYITTTEKDKIASFKDGFSAQLFVSAPFDVFGNL